MKEYDFIFAGGGLAGLSLAYHLIHSPLRDRSMLIIDRVPKTRNDRTWCFWTDRPTLFDRIAYREWSQVRFADDHASLDLDLGSYHYKMIRGIDFYRCVRQDLQASGKVEFLQGSVEAIQEEADRTQVRAAGSTYTGRWAFDSRPYLPTMPPEPAEGHCLQQHFMGWEIETPRAVFSPIPTLMDFRTPQKGALRFFYVLPFSDRRALIEYVSMEPEDYEAAFKMYLEHVCRIQEYQVVATEGGANPLTDRVLPRRTGRYGMNIGLRGGRLKPSTGYAFTRIQKDSAAIVQSLVRTGTPFQVPPDSRRYRLYDSLLLDVMQRNGDQLKAIFAALFKHNPTERVLRFLDEKDSPVEHLRLIASLPPRLFVQALVRTRFAHARVPAKPARPSDQAGHATD